MIAGVIIGFAFGVSSAILFDGEHHRHHSRVIAIVGCILCLTALIISGYIFSLTDYQRVPDYIMMSVAAYILSALALLVALPQTE